ncbi:hypothetical protein PYCCODRAFT_1472540 [Trametes coccinea BRFM310]|uniref:Uncharacterized protein n=2 Tax=Trametes TaxID=5324 RepID=A0A1Y2I5X6_TRAC3|nr:hypothetical protein NUW54_g493 [Trametes sanguinea]OSC96549.1 hypothetical protein PYCCODRAFT_1472540 [Trametes coccinea BRFM310]
MDTLNSRALVTTFGSDAARYFRCVDPAGPDSQDWNHAMVVMTVLSPRCYGVVVKSPSVDHQDDQVVFSSMIQDDWTFAFEEKQQMVRWTTSANQEWFFLRFSLIEDFWLFVSQIAEARQCALRKRLESFDQLEAVVRSFRSFLVMGSAMNATNPYDGREDWSSVLFHDQAPQSEDSEEEDSE